MGDADTRKPAINCGIAGFRSRLEPSPLRESAVARCPDSGRPTAGFHARSDSAEERHLWRANQAVKELPQPQPPVALGLLKVNPEPCMEDT